jgi:hypothetical protein
VIGTGVRIPGMNPMLHWTDVDSALPSDPSSLTALFLCLLMFYWRDGMEIPAKPAKAVEYVGFAFMAIGAVGILPLWDLGLSNLGFVIGLLFPIGCAMVFWEERRRRTKSETL